jgi:hypothetical protein
LGFKEARAREEFRALARRRECGFFMDRSKAILGLFLLAQEGNPLLFRVHGDDHKQTKHHNKQEKNHANRIARTPAAVLYSGFANTKQL